MFASNNKFLKFYTLIFSQKFLQLKIYAYSRNWMQNFKGIRVSFWILHKTFSDSFFIIMGFVSFMCAVCDEKNGWRAIACCEDVKITICYRISASRLTPHSHSFLFTVRGWNLCSWWLKHITIFICAEKELTLVGNYK